MIEYINKSEAYRLLKSKGDALTLSYPAEAYYKAADMISCMKSEDVKPVVHGKWKADTSMLCYVCSECLDIAGWAFDFCPNCSADMRGE